MDEAQTMRRLDYRTATDEYTRACARNQGAYKRIFTGVRKRALLPGAVLSLWQKMLVLRAYRLLLLNYSAVPEPYVLAPANASCDGVGSRLCRASVGEENEEPSVTASPLSSR